MRAWTEGSDGWELASPSGFPAEADLHALVAEAPQRAKRDPNHLFGHTMQAKRVRPAEEGSQGAQRLGLRGGAERSG